MTYGPITVQDAHDMGVPLCFSEEYAYYEQRGLPIPYAGPVYPDYGPDPDWPEPGPEPEPCGGPPTHAFLGLPPAFHPHDPYCCWDDAHAPDADGCPPPF